MPRASRVFAAFVSVTVSAGAASGCYHYSATLPGVLDTRSDGSTADASPVEVNDPELRREGVSAWLAGEGVRTQEALVSVEERHFFAGVTTAFPGVFLLSNADPTPELKAALGDAALRELRVSHEMSALDVVLTLGVNLIPCVPLLLAPQPFTFALSGERVSASGRPPVNRPVAPPVDLTPPPSPAPPSNELVPEDRPDDAGEPTKAAPPAAQDAPAPTPAEGGTP